MAQAVHPRRCWVARVRTTGRAKNGGKIAVRAVRIAEVGVAVQSVANDLIAGKVAPTARLMGKAMESSLSSGNRANHGNHVNPARDAMTLVRKAVVNVDLTDQPERPTTLEAAVWRTVQTKAMLITTRIKVPIVVPKEAQKAAARTPKPERNVHVTVMGVSVAHAVNVAISVAISVATNNTVVSARSHHVTRSRRWMGLVMAPQMAKMPPTTRRAVRLRRQQLQGRRSARPCGRTSPRPPPRLLRRWFQPVRPRPRQGRSRPAPQ